MKPPLDIAKVQNQGLNIGKQILNLLAHKAKTKSMIYDF